MLAAKLQIYQDTYSLAGMLVDNESNVSRQLRYGEYGKALSMIFEALDNILLANSSFEMRLVYIKKVICLIGGVQARLKLYADKGKLAIRFATEANNKVETILAQARGWRDSTARAAYSQGENRYGRSAYIQAGHQGGSANHQR